MFCKGKGFWEALDTIWIKFMKGVFSLHIPKMFVFATFDDVFDDDVVDIVWKIFFFIGKYQQCRYI